MKLCFDTVEELKDFVKTHLKTTRTGKDKDAEETAGASTGAAPAPILPPAGGDVMGTAGAFSPPAGGQAGPFGSTGFAPAGPAPEIIALVTRIGAKVDSAIASGQPAAAALTWLQQQCGAEAANATLDQIKGVFLGKLSQPQLEQIAKLIAA